MLIRAALVTLVLGALVGGEQAIRAAAQPTAPDSVSLPGLREPVEILRDQWGVNHIYAHNEGDLFFAQGYAAARDRLFQFELWRRQATGTVAEWLGRRELTRDIGARLHRFRGDLDAELAHYHPRGRAIVEAYVNGVNAYIAETERNPDLLPLELRMLGSKPGRWTPDVVISRHQALTANVSSEVSYVRAMRALGRDRLRDLLYFQGGEPVFTLDPFIDTETFPDRVLDLYSTFREPVRFKPEDLLPEFRVQPAAAFFGAPAPPAFPASPALPALPAPIDHDIGSNNWVVSGSRTPSGWPMLANDPHRVITAPSLRYLTHLVAPGWDVIGGGEPILPGVSIGHNQHGAWGLTIFGGDNEDLYIYETNPANPNEYRYQGGWEPMRRVSETIPVKGEAAHTVELKFTRQGPVLFEDTTRHRAYALRAGWMEPGSAPYLASLRMNQATTWEEFREATTFNFMPSENMVWAGRDGVIGWQAAGLQPRRKNWSGLLPVPGDGRYEWDGFLPIVDLPHEADPTRGFIATANNYLYPRNYPHREAQHWTGADPYRAARIAEVLGSGRQFTVAEMTRLQSDDLSLPARTLVPLLRDLPLPETALEQARTLLLGWDFVLDKQSSAAGTYVMWQRRVLANVRAQMVPEAARSLVSTGLISTKKILDWLHAPDGRLGSSPVVARDALLVRSLSEAVAELTKRFGADPSSWTYGQAAFHHALIRHPMSDAVAENVRARLEVGPLPRGGDGSTVSATGNADNQTSGGSLKIVADTEDWDNSVAINTPGQSGDPASPHYRDLFELWARGKYFPLAYSRRKVESVRESTLRLVPAGVTTQRQQ